MDERKPSLKYPPKSLPPAGSDAIRQRAREILERETKRIAFDTKNLAPLEHLLIGSSADVSGEMLDVDGLFEAAQRGEQSAYNKLLIPMRIQEDGVETLESVVQERLTASVKREIKPVIAMDIDPSLAQEGLSFCLEPGEVDNTTKRVGSSKISLVDKKGNVVSRDWGNSQISPERTKFFRLDPVTEQPYRLLRPNFISPKVA